MAQTKAKTKKTTKRGRKPARKVVAKISVMKKVINAVKAWLEANGVEGILGFVVGVVFLIFGLKIESGFAFGIFATRNWDIVKNWMIGLLSK